MLGFNDPDRYNSEHQMLQARSLVIPGYNSYLYGEKSWIIIQDFFQT